MILYGLATCDTCRLARKALPHAQFVDVRADGVARDVLEAALERFGPQLLNRRSTTWRSLPEEDRARPAIDLLLAHPTLMKRPLVVEGARMVLGFDKPAQVELGLA